MVTLQSWTANTQGLAAVSALANDDQFRVVQGGVSKSLTAAVLAAYMSTAVSLTVGSMPIVSGTNGYIFYNNAGVLGELATTGSGNVVRATSPTLVTPALGTPSALVLTNATGLPATALIADTTTAVGFGSINLGHASDTTLTRVSAGVVAVEGVTILTTATGQPLDADLTSWAAVTRASGFDTFVATPSSANFAALVTGETGSGALVFGTSPTLASATLTSPSMSAPTMTGAVTFTGGTLNGTLLSMTQTWSGTGTYTGILYNVTDSGPSNAASLFMDLQAGGSSKASIRKDGRIFTEGGVFNNLTSGIFPTGGFTYIYANGVVSFIVSSSSAIAANGATLGLSSGTSADVILARDAANVLALRNSTNAQTFNVYNTYTDASNYELGRSAWVTNVWTIGTTSAGTGGPRNMRIGPAGAATTYFCGGGSDIVSVSSLGFLFPTDNTYDIGASGATRPRTGYFGTSLVSPIHTLPQGTITADAPQINGSVTWNNSGVTFTAWKLNVTDTASASTSLLMDLQKAGTSQFKVSKTGRVTSLDGGFFGNDTGTLTGIFASGSICFLYAGNAAAANIDSSSILTLSNTAAALRWSTDTILARDAANTLAQRNGTNAQAFRAYNTYTDSSNGEWGTFDWSSSANVLTIGTNKNGTGSTRNLRIVVGGTIVADFGVTTAATWTFTTPGAGVVCTGNFQMSATGAFAFGATRTNFTSPSDGVLKFIDSSFASFNRVQFGGETSSFPAIKRDGVGLSARLADDSAGTWMKVLRTTVSGLPSASTSGAGALAIVSDASAPAKGSSVTGGGAVQTLVISDGTNWIAG